MVETAIAGRFKGSTREERKLLYATMYDELFRQVPDHPRLTRRNDEQLTQRANRIKLALVNRFLDKSVLFAEFAPGDCKFAFEVAKHVKWIHGIDISDQSDPADSVPENFNLIIYDGYDLKEINRISFDIVFSDQLIEHFHPEETRLHFELIHRILKVGGKYIFRTPHSFSGPHDISAFFSDEPEGFHLKEWTYIELRKMIMDLNYSKFHTYFSIKRISFRVPYSCFAIFEKIIGLLPKRYMRVAATIFFRSIVAVAIK